MWVGFSKCRKYDEQLGKIVETFPFVNNVNNPETDIALLHYNCILVYFQSLMGLKKFPVKMYMYMVISPIVSSYPYLQSYFILIDEN